MDTENNRLRTARRKLGLTLEQLSARIGYSIGTISGVENGHDSPSRRLRARLIETLSLNEKWLRTGRGEMFSSPLAQAVGRLKPASRAALTQQEEAVALAAIFDALKKRLERLPAKERKKYVSAFLSSLPVDEY